MERNDYLKTHFLVITFEVSLYSNVYIRGGYVPQYKGAERGLLPVGIVCVGHDNVQVPSADKISLQIPRFNFRTGSHVDHH